MTHCHVEQFWQLCPECVESCVCVSLVCLHIDIMYIKRLSVCVFVVPHLDFEVLLPLDWNCLDSTLFG